MGRKRLKIESFMDFVYPEPNTGCWIWAGTIGPQGYGTFAYVHKGIRMTRANRISYLIHKGEFDQNLFVCHSCDNTSCVNPDHLFLGTGSDNTNDAVKKGRWKANKKLNKEQVILIREKIYNGVPQKELAKEYNVLPQTISAIHTRVSWIDQ